MPLMDTEKYGIGQAVSRFEDPRLLRGAGRYVNDVSMARQAYAYFLRSPYAHAKIAKIDTIAAQSSARRARRFHRGRCRGGEARHDAAGAAAQTRRRLAGVFAAASGAGARHRALCRRSGGDGRRRESGRGEGRGRADPDRLRRAARHRRHRGCAEARRAARLGREPRQRLAISSRPATKKRPMRLSRRRRMW